MYSRTETLTASSPPVIKVLGVLLIIATLVAVIAATFFYANELPDIEDQEEVENSRAVSRMAIFLGAFATIFIGLALVLQGGDGEPEMNDPNASDQAAMVKAKILIKYPLVTFISDDGDTYTEADLTELIAGHCQDDNVSLIDCCFDEQEMMFGLLLGPDNGSAKTLEECKSSKCSSEQINTSVTLFRFGNNATQNRGSSTRCVDQNPTFKDPKEYTVVFRDKTKTIFCPNYESSEDCDAKVFGLPYAIHAWLMIESSDVTYFPWFVPVGNDGKSFKLVPFEGLTGSSLSKDEFQASKKYMNNSFEELYSCT